MGYTANYDTTDIREAAVDTGAVFIIEVASLAGVIILILMFGWFMRKLKTTGVNLR